MDLNNQSEGSGQPLLTQSIIYKQECIIPPYNLRTEFDKMGYGIYQNKIIINKENKVLTELQSLLLAKVGCE